MGASRPGGGLRHPGDAHSLHSATAVGGVRSWGVAQLVAVCGTGGPRGREGPAGQPGKGKSRAVVGRGRGRNALGGALWPAGAGVEVCWTCPGAWPSPRALLSSCAFPAASLGLHTPWPPSCALRPNRPPTAWPLSAQSWGVRVGSSDSSPLLTSKPAGSDLSQWSLPSCHLGTDLGTLELPETLAGRVGGGTRSPRTGEWSLQRQGRAVSGPLALAPPVTAIPPEQPELCPCSVQWPVCLLLLPQPVWPVQSRLPLWPWPRPGLASGDCGHRAKLLLLPHRAAAGPGDAEAPSLSPERD